MKPFILMFPLLVLLAACGADPKGSNSSSSSTPDSPGTPDVGGGTQGKVSDKGIFISVVPNEQPVTTYLHQFYNFSTPCTIPPTAALGQDIQCLLNVRELDLYDQGLKLQFNVPASMCPYVADIPYWFYNYQAGHIPKSVDMRIDEVTPANNYCTVKNDAGTTIVAGVSIKGTTCIYPGGFVALDGTVSSSYDYTGNGGPNCAAGVMAFSSEHDTSTAPAILISKKSTLGGYESNCAMGPWRDSKSGWKVDGRGGPAEQVRAAINGFNQFYAIKPPIKLRIGANLYGANFWDWTSYSAGSLSPASLPTAMKSSVDLLSNTMTTPNTAYTFLCMDEGHEVKHRIRLYVNEWDTGPNFLAYGVAGATSNTPVATGTCDVTSGPCDDFVGWPKFTTGYPNMDDASL